MLNAKAEPKNTEYNVGFYNDSGEFSSSDSLATYKYNSAGVFQSGTVKNAGITSNTRYGEDHNETTDLALGFRWNASDKLTFGGNLQFVKSTAKVYSMTDFLQIKNKVDATIDISGDLPNISISTPNTTADPSTYWWAAAMDHLEKNDGKEVAARLDGNYDFDSGFIKSFKFGVRATEKDYNTRQTNYNWGLLSAQYWGGGTPVYASTTGASTYSVIAFNNFMNGAVPVPGVAVFPNVNTVNSSSADSYAILKATESAGWGWSPVNSSYYYDDPTSGGLNTQNEKTFSAYVTAKFATSLTLAGSERIIDGNFGVRYVKTREQATGYAVSYSDTDFGNTCTVGSGVTAAQCVDYEAARTFKSTAMTPISIGGTHEYSNILPSLNARLKWNDKLQFRFAASKGMVRPDMSQLMPYESLSMNQNKGSYTIVPTGTSGNPMLNPIRAEQYDLTGEWYFTTTGSLTLDLFSKDLHNYIYQANFVEPYTNNGKTINFNVTRYTNGSQKAKVNGFELAYSQFFDFLPSFWSGLGVQGNYTHIDSKGGRDPNVTIFDSVSKTLVVENLNDLPLEGMSPESYNVAVMYEKYGISARLAYNWRSTYLYTTSAANVNRPLWAKAYGQVDGSVFYTLNSNYKIGMQITNLGHSTTTQLVSSDLTNPQSKQWYSAIKTDRRVSFVVRGLF